MRALLCLLAVIAAFPWHSFVRCIISGPMPPRQCIFALMTWELFNHKLPQRCLTGTALLNDTAPENLGVYNFSSHEMMEGPFISDGSSFAWPAAPRAETRRS